MSRLQALSGHSLWSEGPWERPAWDKQTRKEWLSETAEARKLIAKEYVRMAVGGMATYMLMTAALSIKRAQDPDVEHTTDPASTDFLKLKVGDYRMDLLAGLQQIAVLGSRIFLGEKTTQKGKTVPLLGTKKKFGQSDIQNELMQFHYRKLHPAITAAIEARQGHDWKGDPVTPTDVLLNFVTPISMKDMYESAEELGLPRSIIADLMLFYGVAGGVQKK
jgi:hypothetical protein